MRIREKMLILPALYIIKRKGTATTADLINELTIAFNPTGEDAEILAGRNDTKFSQKVRNLVSHRDSNGMSRYTNFVDVYSVTQEGDALLTSKIETFNYFFSQKFQYDDTLDFAGNMADKKKNIYIYDENILISEGKIEIKKSRTRVRSKVLRDAAIAYYSEKRPEYLGV